MNTHHLVLCAILVAGELTGCAVVDRINPWAGSQEQVRAPINATEFQCKDRKSFHARFDAAGKSAWVIFPEREFRLDAVESGSGARYSNGRTTLHTRGDEAFVLEGTATLYADCKRSGAK